MDIKNKIEESKARYFESRKKDINNLSYWFPKIKNCGIKVPDTIIIPLSFKQFCWLTSDHYEDNKIKEFSNQIKKCIGKTQFKDTKKLFMKTGTFSNKFDFSASCKVEDMDKIGEQFLNMYYASMCVGDGCSTEIIIREFIESEQGKATIYNGMPLNTEFRVFYDFDNKKVLEIFNYWDRETMNKSLIQMRNKDDANTFIKNIDEIEKDFKERRGKVIDLISKHMREIELTGQWSIDIMKANGEFYLIDMATAKSSYYYNKLSEN